MLSALILVLASCSNGPSIEDAGLAKQSGQAVPPMAIMALDGMPPDKASAMAEQFAIAAGSHDIGIAEGTIYGGTHSLSGRFNAAINGASVHLAYRWELRDGQGALLHTAEGIEDAGMFTGESAWAAVTPTVMQRVARSAADSMAIRLAQLGYATRVARLDMPPPEYFVAAGADAEREVDFGTLDGVPDASMAALDGLGPEADVTEQGQASAAPEPPKETKVAEATPLVDDTPAAAPEGKQQIRAVAVLPVKGAGDGNAELTSAMRRTLSAAGWPVVSKPQADAIIVVGKVRVSEARDGAQDVSVRWEVQSPAGKQLGDVKQANRVPAGAFDHGWGDAAFAVAEAAAVGIFDIVKTYR